MPHDETAFGGDVWRAMRSVAAGGPGLVAVGYELELGAVVWTSADGRSWSRVPHDETAFGWTMESVVVWGQGLVAVGGDEENAAVCTSP